MNFKLILGYKCNLRCPYCYMKDNLTDNKDMSYKVIDKFLERFNKLEGYNSIHFFGGEPLLYADKIKYIMDRIPKETTFLTISTNAVNRETFYELEEYWGSEISNLISNKENKNYHKLNDVSAFRWVVTHENMKLLNDDIVKFLAYEYKENITFTYDLTEKWELEDVQFMEKVIAKYKSIVGKSCTIKYLPHNLNTKFECLGGGSCKINYNGDYLACHRVQDSVIGNVFENELSEHPVGKCLFYNQKHLDNLYSYGNYKFKGASIFRCD